VRRLVAILTFVLAGAAPLGAQVVSPPGPPPNTPPELYVPLRDAFLATLRANATTDTRFNYASALQKLQAGDLLGAQREAGAAILSSGALPAPILQGVKSAIALPLTSLPGPALLAPVPITIAPGPGVPQATTQRDLAGALAFARAEIALAELRTNHPVEAARAAYVEATAAYERSDAPAAIGAAQHAADLALDAYLAGP
jgi:hypothetical protein